MQEVFSKIIEKISNEYLKFNEDDWNGAIDRAIEIVKQEAEKYQSSECGFISKSEVLRFIEEIKCNDDIPKNYGTLLDIMIGIRNMPTVDNNGWIPCSEHLPKENGYYYVTQIVKSISTGKKIAIEKAHVEFLEGKWRRAKHLEVVAWLDIETFQPKGE